MLGIVEAVGDCLINGHGKRMRCGIHVKAGVQR
jgi:hypothetical protein